VACQAFEGEALLIHFERGHYFSAVGAAGMLLALVERGCSVAELQAALVRSWPVDAEQAARAVTRFVDELLQEELVVPVSDAGPRLPAPTAGGLVAPSGAFEEPRLIKYTDLEDLLVLDPIHEIMVSAWPAAAG
jgi:hypothetical protein